MMLNVDPRALGDVVDQHGDGLNFDDEIRMLTSACSAGVLTAIPNLTAGATPTDAEINISMLVPWLDDLGYTDMAAGLRHGRSKTRGGDASRIMKRNALIAAHEREWETIERDLRDASKNKLGEAAMVPDQHGMWHEAQALKWARERGKLKSAGGATASLPWPPTS